jgi:hypothetical protein
MKTKIYAAAVLGLGFLMFGNNAKAQIQDEQNVTITMDLQPVLQLNMNTPDEVNFTFNSIGSYIGGEVKYGATILTVSSTVTWDLYAVGTSSAGTAFWDNAVDYGLTTAIGATKQIPLDALELHQTGANPNVTANGSCVGVGDYSLPFQNATTAPATPGQNNIYCTNTTNPYVVPTPGTNKYIAGGPGTVGPPATSGGVVGGSYLTQSAAFSNYYYVIDYRIVPGLPVIFPFSGTDQCTPDVNAIGTVGNPGTFAQPGVYTMDVKYVLIEAQ